LLARPIFGQDVTHPTNCIDDLVHEVTSFAKNSYAYFNTPHRR
jgi:hypothetical protein